MAGIILSGGENTRMGRNKAFLTLKGRMFLWIIIEALTPLFRDLILVTREPDLYAGFPVRRVVDVVPERGALTGIYSGLSASRDPKNFCVACDMPLIKRGLVQYMMNAAQGFDAVIPAVGLEAGPTRQVEPLHAVYDKRCLPMMAERLKEGRRGLQDCVHSLDNVRFLSAKEVALFDPELNAFRNINRPEEYEALTNGITNKKRGGLTPKRRAACLV